MKLYPLDIECYRYSELGFAAKQYAIEECKKILYKDYKNEDIPKDCEYDIVRELTSGFGDYFDKKGNYIHLTFHETEEGFLRYITYRDNNNESIKVNISNENCVDVEGNILSIGDKVRIVSKNKIFTIKDFEKGSSLKVGKGGLSNYKFTNCKANDVMKIL